MNVKSEDYNLNTFIPYKVKPNAICNFLIIDFNHRIQQDHMGHIFIYAFEGFPLLFSTQSYLTHSPFHPHPRNYECIV